MNNALDNPTEGSVKHKFKLKRHHLYLIGSLVVIAGFVTYLTDYASYNIALAGMCTLAVMTMVTALAAFFKAYAKD